MIDLYLSLTKKLAFVLTCILLLNNVNAQTLQPAYGAPSAPISACNYHAFFKIKVLGGSRTCNEAVINIQLPNGYVYINESAVITSGNASLSQLSYQATQVQLSLQEIPAAPDSVIITYQALADCSAAAEASASNQVKYTLTSSCTGTQHSTSNTFNTQNAALHFSKITHQNYQGSVGDVYNREITITNNGLGNVSQITVLDTSGNGISINEFSISPGWTVTKTKAASGTDTISTFLLTGPALQQGQSVTLTETITLVNNCYLQGRLNAFYGCNGNRCTVYNANASASAGASVNNSLTPSLAIDKSGVTALHCRETPYTQTVSFINTGSTNLHNLQFNIFVATWSAVAATQHFNPNTSFTNGAQAAYSGFRYKLGINGVWASLTPDSTASFNNPGSNIYGLPSSVYFTIPLIKNGDTLYLSYNEQNSILPAAITGNTVDNSGSIIRYSYSDACGSTAPTMAMFLRDYQGLRINTQTTMPANIEAGKTYEFSYFFSEASAGIYKNTGPAGSSIRFELTLPDKVNFSGNPADVAITRNNTVYGGIPTSFSYNSISKTISLTYAESSSFSISGLRNATLTFKGLTLNCAATNNNNVVQLKYFAKALSTCAEEEEILAVSKKLGFVCPQTCDIKGGISFDGFSLERSNYGLPDNDNDGLPDTGNSIDTANIKTTYAIIGDTIVAAFYGRINTGDPMAPSMFRYGYAIDTFSGYGNYITSLYASIQLFGQGKTTAFYTCNTLPVSGGTGNIRKVDFSISALNALNGCTLPGGYTAYNNGDSVIIKIYYKVSANSGSSGADISTNNRLLISEVANPQTQAQFSCGSNYSGTISLVGIHGGAGTGNLTYSTTGRSAVDTRANNQLHVGPCCVSAGSRPFVYEYRSITYYDSMSYIKPEGYDVEAATIVYNYTREPGITASITTPITPLNASADTLVFNLKTLFEEGTLPYGDQGSSITAIVKVRPNCSAPPKTTARFYIRQVASPQSGITLNPLISIIYDTIYLTAADLKASAINNNATSDNDTASWEIQLSNAAPATASDVWIAQALPNSNVTITSIEKLNAPGGAAVATILPDNNGIYQLGVFNQASHFYRINAQYDKCDMDSLILAYGYDCSGQGYPSAVPALTGSSKKLNLYVSTNQSSLQLSITSQPLHGNAISSCDTLKYHLEVLNTGPGLTQNLRVITTLPATGGISYLPGSFSFQPVAGGDYIHVHDSMVTSSSPTQMEFSVPPNLLTQLKTAEALKMVIGFTSGCNFVSGQTLRFTPTAELPCGQAISGAAQYSEKIQLAGIPENNNLYKMSSSADTVFSTCGSTQDLVTQYKLKIINEGPLYSSQSDIFSVELPTPWEMDTTSIQFIHNPGQAVFWKFAHNQYYFRMGEAVAVGDSVTLNATIRVKAIHAASVTPNTNAVILENVLLLYESTCRASGNVCSSSQVLVNQYQLTTIPVKAPLFSVNGFSIQQNITADHTLSGSLHITQPGSSYTAQDITLKLYKDVDENGIAEPHDTLLGEQVLTISAAPSQSVMFNIPSSYNGVLCPRLLAVTDFGCYSTSYIFNCNAALPVLSNAGAIKKIEQCNNNIFELQALNTTGKWVVDSGNVHLSAPNAAITAATVEAGNAVRLLWLSNVVSNNTNSIIYPDTIRLINHSLPVVDLPQELFACVGSPLTLTTAAIAQPATVQWMKDGIVIPAATDASLTVTRQATTADEGMYSIQATTDAGCIARDSVTVVVTSLLTAQISYPNISYCASGEALVNISGQAGGVFSSTEGLAIDAATGTLNLEQSQPGTYTIHYAANNQGCAAEAYTTVTIHQQPVIIITNPDAVCQPATVNLTAIPITAGSSPNLSYTYFSDAATTIPLENPTAIANSGTFFISGKNQNGCSVSMPVTVTINTTPVASIAYPNGPYCTTGTATVQHSGQTGGTYTAPQGISINPQTGAIDLNTSLPGLYNITYTFTQNNCTEVATSTIDITEPILTVHMPEAVCAPATVDITIPETTAGSTPGLTYYYFADAGGTTALATPASITLPGTYYIQGAINGSSCATTLQPIEVVINQSPALVLSADKSQLCAGEKTTLYAHSPGSTIVWQNQFQGDNLQVYPEKNTTYTAVATSNTGCTQSAQIGLHVIDFNADITANPNPVIEGTSTALTVTANQPYSVIEWLPSLYFTGQSSSTQNLVATNTLPTLFAIVQSQHGCKDTASIDIQMIKISEEIYAPTAFTPNADGRNDVFRVNNKFAKSMEMKIYNQWGNLVATVNDISSGWDGTYRGIAQPAGTYIYSVRLRLLNDKEVTRFGTVTLIR